MECRGSRLGARATIVGADPSKGGPQFQTKGHYPRLDRGEGAPSLLPQCLIGLRATLGQRRLPGTLTKRSVQLEPSALRREETPWLRPLVTS